MRVAGIEALNRTAADCLAYVPSIEGVLECSFKLYTYISVKISPRLIYDVGAHLYLIHLYSCIIIHKTDLAG